MGVPLRAGSFGIRKLPIGCIPKLGYVEVLNMKRTRIIAAGRAAKEKQAHHILLLLTALWNSPIAHPRLSCGVPSCKVCFSHSSVCNQCSSLLLQTPPSLLPYLKVNHPSGTASANNPGGTVMHLSPEMMVTLCDEKHEIINLCLRHEFTMQELCELTLSRPSLPSFPFRLLIELSIQKAITLYKDKKY